MSVSINNAINNTVGASNAAATNTLTITNPSNTASSTALTLSTVGGSSAYGAYNRWAVGSTQSWAMGIVNLLQGGQPQNFVLAAAANGTANINSSTIFMACDLPQRKIGLFDAIAFSASTSDFSLQKTALNTAVSIAAVNADTAGSSSDSVLSLLVGNGTSGASYVNLGTLTGGNNFTMARTTSNVFQLSSAAVGLQMTSAGVVTLPASPLGLTSGGTAASLTASNGGIVYSNASTLAVLAGTATSGQVLRSGASTTPSWSTATYPATAGTSGNVLTSDGTNWTSAAAAGNVAGPGASTDRAIATWNGTGGTALFNNSTATIDSSGRQKNTAQPAFLAYLATSDTNATGDATTFTLGSATALTEVFDQGGDFNTNGTFTAPVTGRYSFSVTVQSSNYAVGHTIGVIQIVTSNRTFQVVYGNPFLQRSSTDVWGANGTVLVDMDSGDTATANIVVAGSTKTVTVIGNAAPFTSFSGHLVC